MTKTALTLGICLLLAFGCAPQQRELQNTNQFRDTLQSIADIQIRKQTADLIKTVEKLYDKRLCVASFEEKAKCGTLIEETIGDNFGSAVVSFDGSPVVLLAENGRNESTFAHELFHLKLTAEGYPTLEYHIDNTLKADVINLIVTMVFTALEHRVFYPEMRKIGLDPDDLERAELYDLISGKIRATPIVSDVQVRTRAASVFKTAMECGDQCDKEKTMDRLTSWYENQGWHTSLSFAKKMIRTVESKKPSSPEAVTNTGFECVAELLMGQVIITPMEWKTIQRGKVIQRIAPYHVSLPK